MLDLYNYIIVTFEENIHLVYCKITENNIKQKVMETPNHLIDNRKSKVVV